MRFDIITLFPEMFSALQFGITGRAQKQHLIDVHTWNPRDFAQSQLDLRQKMRCEAQMREQPELTVESMRIANESATTQIAFRVSPDRRIDDRPYGGGPGMVMQYQPLHDAIHAAKKAHTTKPTVVYLSPQGQLLTQKKLKQIAKPNTRLILIAGRYEGIDERVIIRDVDEEWSIGDYVMSGGELPAMIVIDALTRLLPNTLGDPESAAQDSFQNDLLDYPHYTRPAEIDGLSVPAVLQSGDHQAIATWRQTQSLGKTWQKRPDLLQRRVLTDDEKQLLQMYIDTLRISP